ncbi:MAG: AAA family ATPase [Candidatus Aenigmarchaeota archaeon]|nr:AAA family ATPase [Candidatus Aenigmarchaeota archaeon]
MVWYERYGWNSNPFEQKPKPDLISGFEDIRSQVLEFVKSGDCCLLTGIDGMGKTTILKWLESYDLGDFEPIYINTSGMTEKEIKILDIDKIIREKANIFSKLRKKESNIVLLIDDAEKISSTVADAIKRNLDNNIVKSVVLAASETKKIILSKRIGSRKIEMRLMKSDEALGMILKRVGYKNPFDHESLEIIFAKAYFLPQKILELCENIAMSNIEKSITKNFVDAFFGLEGGLEKSIPLMERLSPLQRRIVIVLKTGNHRPSEIAKKLKKPAKTITSQLAILGLKSGVKMMQRKGIEDPIVEKVEGAHAVYRLTDSARRVLIKE